MAKLAKELPELIQKVCADFVSYIGIYYMTREYTFFQAVILSQQTKNTFQYNYKTPL